MTSPHPIYERLELKRAELLESEITQAKQESNVRAAQALLAETTRRTETLRTEVATWEEAIGLLNSSEQRAHINGHAANGDRPRPAFATSSDDRRGPKGAWRNVMPELARQYPTGEFRLSDVAAAAELVGETVRSDALRSQMSNYVKSGALHRVANGRFQFTDQGRETFTDLSANQMTKSEQANKIEPPSDYAGGSSNVGSQPDIQAGVHRYLQPG